MSILNRCVQFGRRHLWPHLLLGVVAAGVTSASTVNDAHPESPANPAISRSAQPALTNSAVRLRNEWIAPVTPHVALHASFSQPEQASAQSWRPVSGFFARLAKILAPHTPHAGSYVGSGWPEATTVQHIVPEPVIEATSPLPLLYPLLLSATLCFALWAPLRVILSTAYPLTFSAYLPSRWLAQVQGIRAGPMHWA